MYIFYISFKIKMFILSSSINISLPSKKHYKHILKNMQKIKELRARVRHAKLVCFGYEDTIECEVAWQKVDALVNSLRENDAEYTDTDI